MSFNTQYGYNLDTGEPAHIGRMQEWNYLGMEASGKSKWGRNPNFPQAVKADGGGNNYVCCQKRCFALIVNQGSINQWSFRRNTISADSRKSHGECDMQVKIAELPNMDVEAFVEFAKEILCLFLMNENGGKEDFRVKDAQRDREIPDSPGVTPSITILHNEDHSREETYVEIQVDKWINEGSFVGDFYEGTNPKNGKRWLEQTVFLSFRGQEKGLHYDKRKLPVEVIDQFKRRMADNRNVRREYEDAKGQKIANDEEERAEEEQERLESEEQERLESEEQERLEAEEQERLEAEEKIKRRQGERRLRRRLENIDYLADRGYWKGTEYTSLSDSEILIAAEEQREKENTEILAREKERGELRKSIVLGLIGIIKDREKLSRDYRSYNSRKPDLQGEQNFPTAVVRQLSRIAKTPWRHHGWEAAYERGSESIMHHARNRDLAIRLSDEIIDTWHNENDDITDSELLQLIEKTRASDRIALEEIGSKLRIIADQKTLDIRRTGMSQLRSKLDWLRKFARENPSIIHAEEQADPPEIRFRAFTKLCDVVIDAEGECVRRYIEDSTYSQETFCRELVESEGFTQSGVPELFEGTDYFGGNGISSNWYGKFRGHLVALIKEYEVLLKVHRVTRIPSGKGSGNNPSKK